MSRFKSNKEDVNLPVDDVSLGDVEKDIKDLQSFIANLKSEEDGRVEGSNSVKDAPPSKRQVKKPYFGEDFDSKRERDLLLFDFPQVNNKVEDMRDSLLQDYIRDLASMNPEEVLGRGSLDVRNTDELNQITLQDERHHSGLQYPEHIVERSDRNLRDGSNEYVTEPNSKTQGRTSHSVNEGERRHGSYYIHSQQARKHQIPTRANVNETKPKTEKKIAAPTKDQILKGLHNKGESPSIGNTPTKKGHKSKHAGLTVSFGEEKQAPDKGKTTKTSLTDDAKGIRKSNKHGSRMHSRQSFVSSVKHQAHRAETVEAADTSATQGASKYRTVSVQKRRGKNRKQKVRYHNPNPRRRPPPRRKPPPTTTTELTTTTTTTTESSTWTTQPVTNRTMQEIVDSGVEKIDIALTDSGTWHAIVHGRRDIVLAGAIMGGIGLLLIILSVVYMFVNRRKTQQKIADVSKNNKKSYQRFGSAEETAKLTGPQHSLFPLSSDEDTTGESDEDSTHHLTEIKGPPGKRNAR